MPSAAAILNLLPSWARAPFRPTILARLALAALLTASLAACGDSGKDDDEEERDEQANAGDRRRMGPGGRPGPPGRGGPPGMGPRGRYGRQRTPTPTPAPTPTPNIEQAKVAIEQIRALTAGVFEYTCLVQFEAGIDTRDNPNYRRNAEELGFREPDLFYRKTWVMQNPDPTLVGRYEHAIVDGKKIMHYAANNPESAQYIGRDAQPPLPEAERARLTKEFTTPVMLQYDIARARQTGASDELILHKAIGFVVRPFGFFRYSVLDLDMNAAGLLYQDAEFWVIDIPARTDPSFRMRVTIAKQDGLVTRAENTRNGVVLAAWSIGEIKIDHGLPQKAFDATPPPGVQVTDKTDSLIRTLTKPNENSP